MGGLHSEGSHSRHDGIHPFISSSFLNTFPVNHSVRRLRRSSNEKGRDSILGCRASRNPMVQGLTLPRDDIHKGIPWCICVVGFHWLPNRRENISRVFVGVGNSGLESRKSPIPMSLHSECRSVSDACWTFELVETLRTFEYRARTEELKRPTPSCQSNRTSEATRGNCRYTLNVVN
jgi:hypothetical protein